MTQRIVVLDEAEEELVAAEAWHEDQRPGFGVDFRLAIDDAMKRLAEAPRAAPLLQTVPESLGARSAFVNRFPYSLVFIEHDSELWAIAVAHQHRRPGCWRERLRR
jgi:hypothetical protein